MSGNLYGPGGWRGGGWTWQSVIDAVSALTQSALMRAVFGPNTMVKADTDGAPVAFTVPPSMLVGRAATGDIRGLSGPEVVTLLGGPFAADAATTTALAGKADLVGGKVPTAQVGGAGASVAKYLRGDQSWQDLSAITPPDATAAVKGIVQLAGDLGGTAAAPTVPGLAGKQPTIPPNTYPDNPTPGVARTAVVTATDQTIAGIKTFSAAPVFPASSVPKASLGPLAVVDADVSAGAAIAEAKLALASDAAAGVASRRTLGTGALQASAGDDARLSNQRVPTDGSVTTAKIADGSVTTAKIAALEGATATTPVLATRVTGDGAFRSQVLANGELLSGDGAVGPLLSGYTRSGSTSWGRGAGAADTSATLAALGVNALLSNTTGVNNSAVGVGALQSNTTGGSNSAAGRSALQSNTTGASNSAVGVNALYSNTTGGSNSAVGVGALQSNTTGANNSALGVYALLSNTTGVNNSAAGRSALQSNTTGASNSAVGVNALYSNTTGGSNSAVGVSALYAPAGIATNATTTALRQTALGMEAGQGSATQSNDITVVGYRAIADGNNATALGSGASAGAAGAVAIGKDSAGTSASTTTANQIKLGTASHSLMGPGAGTGINGNAPVAKAAAIASPTAPGAVYIQAEAASAKTAIDAIRVALTNLGVTL